MFNVQTTLAVENTSAQIFVKIAYLPTIRADSDDLTKLGFGVLFGALVLVGGKGKRRKDPRNFGFAICDVNAERKDLLFDNLVGRCIVEA
jgi:hypothetical protein